MDPAAIASLLSLGPYGVAALCIAGLIWQNKKIDDIRIQQIADTKTALDVVAKSTDNISRADERQLAQTEASKELIAMIRVLINKGQV